MSEITCPECAGTGKIAGVGKDPIPPGLLADDLVGNVRRRLEEGYGREEYRILTMLEDLRALCDAVEYLLAEREANDG